MRLAGDEVVRLEIMKVDGQKIVAPRKKWNSSNPPWPKVQPNPRFALRMHPVCGVPGEEADPNSPAAGGRAPAPLPPPDPMGQDGPAHRLTKAF